METRRENGIALINALVIVMALGATSQLLLTRAMETQAALRESQGTAQADIYLESGIVLVQNLLTSDWAQDETIDHLGEPWAQDGYAVPIDRGVLSGQILDLQGRFNVNWLQAADPVPARRALDRLVGTLGLDLGLSARIATAVRAAGAGASGGIATEQNGDLRTVAQLRGIPGIDAEAFERLAPYLAALPRDTALNVNTASSSVLVAVFTIAQPDRVAALLRNRETEPFASRPAFDALAAERLGDRISEARLPVDLSVRSEYFLAALRANLDGVVRRRQVMLWRDHNTGAVRVRQRRVSR